MLLYLKFRLWKINSEVSTVEEFIWLAPVSRSEIFATSHNFGVEKFKS